MQKDKRLTKHKLAVARCFSGSAKTYHEAAFLEKEVGERLLDRLDFIKHEPATILDLGGGIGYFSKKLAERYSKATILNFDLAEGMLRQARIVQGGDALSTFITACADAEVLPLANNSIDFIFSNCVFHWSLDISLLFNEIHRVLKPDGLLLFSSLGPDTLKELRECFYQINSDQKLPHIPHVNNFMDMHNVGDALLHAKFSDPVMDMEQFILTFPNIFRLLEDIKKSGSSYVLRERHVGLSTQSVFKKLSDNYDQFKLASGEIPATVEIIYGHAWGTSKKAASYCSSLQEQNNDYRIPLSAIRRPLKE